MGSGLQIEPIPASASAPHRLRRLARTNTAQAPQASTLGCTVSNGADTLLGVTAEKAFLKMLSASSLKTDVLALVIVDVDHFRALRTVYGASATDCLLRALVKRLDAATASQGGRMVRLGTDEFAVLVPAGGCQPSLLDWAKSLIGGLHVSHRQAKFPATLSAGLALYSGFCKTPAEALRCARHAVTQAKQSGGGLTTCTLRQLREACDRGVLALDLPGAITRGDLVPFYQPVVSLRTHRVIGMEVLARWKHAKLGLLEPSSFIPLVEERGLCFALTRALLQQVLADSLTWPAPWTFAFNTSPNELASVIDFIEGAERGTAAMMPGARIELEVTENALMQDLDRARRAVAAMKPYGIKIVLDDFGSGYANFNQLCQVPFSRLKIDKSLITDMMDDTRAQACAQAIIDLAHHLGMTATAEGVETASLADRLAEMGCDHAQGYYFGRPMPASAVAALIDRSTKADGDFGWAA